MMKAEKQEARAVVRCLEKKRELLMQLAEVDRAIKANGRRIYDRHGYFGGIDERLVEQLAVKDLAA